MMTVIIVKGKMILELLGKFSKRLIEKIKNLLDFSALPEETLEIEKKLPKMLLKITVYSLSLTPFFTINANVSLFRIFLSGKGITNLPFRMIASI